MDTDGRPPPYLQDTQHDDVVAQLCYATLSVSMLNMDVFEDTKGNTVKVNKQIFQGLEYVPWRGIQCGFKISGEQQPWTSSIKYIMCRYLAKCSHILESSFQLMGGFSHWRNFGSRIIHPWCGCWWISTIMVLLTQGSVSISYCAQTVMGEAWVVSHLSHVLKRLSALIPWCKPLIWQIKESNRLNLFPYIKVLYVIQGAGTHPFHS